MIETLDAAYANRNEPRDGRAEVTAMLIASPEFQLR